jgi:raffinose/stachyose/melibiose transport system substrate-binding protein
MKMKKIIPAALVMAALLAGCAKDSGSSKKGIEFFALKPEAINTLRKLADRFTAENPDIPVTLTILADGATSLRSRLTRNDMPDLIAIQNDFTYYDLVEAGVFLDLGGEAFLKDVNPGYMPILLDVQPAGKPEPYGIPYAANAAGVLYNKEIFTRYNVAIPETWDEFIAAANTFKRNGVNPFLLTFGDPWTLLPMWNALCPVLLPPGYAAKLRDGSAVFSGTHEEVLRKMARIIELCENDYMGTSYADGSAAFGEGRAAMLLNGNWVIPEVMKANPGAQLGYFTFPAAGEPAQRRLVSGIDVALAVCKSTKNKEAALKFVAFMMRPENALQYINEQFAFSALNGVTQNDPSVQGVAPIITAGQVVDFIDHSYPSGFDIQAVLSQFALNKKNGMDDERNIRESLLTADTLFQAVK